MTDLTRNNLDKHDSAQQIAREGGFKVYYDPITNTVKGHFVSDPKFAELIIDFLKVAMGDIVPPESKPKPSKQPSQMPTFDIYDPTDPW